MALPDDPLRTAPTTLNTTVVDARPGGRATHQWSAIAAGAVAGFAVTVVMWTLGSAIGLSVGAANVDEAAAGQAGELATGFGIGAAIWVLLTAVVVGLVGGTVLGRTSEPERPFHAPTLGMLTWSLGIALAVMLASSTTAGILGTVAGASGAAAANEATAARDANGVRDGNRAVPREATIDRGAATPEQTAERQRAAADAAAAATTAAWVAFAGQLIALGLTIAGAKAMRKRALGDARTTPAYAP